jgi:hypothetical protein
MAERRDEPLRIRLSPSDLAKVTAIQEYLGSTGEMNSLGKVVSNAIDAYYDILVSEGAVSPNL